MPAVNRPWLKSYAASTPPALEYPERTLPDLLKDTAAAHPDHIATSMNDADLTYREINEKANGFAHVLKRSGIGRGDRVAFVLPNSPTYVIAFFGALKAGAVVVNINVTAPADELAWLLTETGARAAVTLDLFLQGVLTAADEAPVEHIFLHSVFGLEQKMETGRTLNIFNDLVSQAPREEPEPACRPDDAAVLQCTSGTTGRPKIARLTHRSMAATVVQADAWIKPEESVNPGLICIIPFFHVFGITAGLLLAVFKAYRMLLIPTFDALSVLNLLKNAGGEKVICLPAVPTIWAALVRRPDVRDGLLADIDVCVSGGGPLPPAVQEEFNRLTGRRILEAYGLSEASGATHMSPYPEGAEPGVIGLPLPDTDARVVDPETGADLPPGRVGEMLVRGPQIMDGYYNDEELTARVFTDGWLRTGDLAVMDEAGLFTLVDRKDDMIISKGFNVYPSEIEEVIMEMPGVADAAVVGRPDRLRGEAVIAYVVGAEDAAPDKDRILEHCRGRLAEYKVPRSVVYTEFIPRNPVGKPLRKELRSQGQPAAAPA